MRLPSGTVWKIWDPAHQCHRASDRVLCGIRAENTLGLSRESGPGGSTRAGWKATDRHSFQTSSFSRPLSLPTFLIFPSGAFLRAPLLPLTLPFSHSTGAGEMASEKKKTSLGLLQGTFQRLTGIEPASQPWEGRILPMNYNRVSQLCQYTISIRPRQQLLYLSPMCHGQQTEGGQFPPSGRFGRFEMSAALPSPDLFNSNIARGFGTAEPLRGSYSRINLRRKWAGVFCRLQTSERGPRFSRFCHRQV